MIKLQQFFLSVDKSISGKIRGPIPYQPAYTKPETPEEEILNYDPTLNYDPRMHQVKNQCFNYKQVDRFNVFKVYMNI